MCVNRDLSFQRETATQLFLVSGSSAGTGSVESWSCSCDASAPFPVLLRGGDCSSDWAGGTWWPQGELVMVAIMVSSASTEVHLAALPLLSPVNDTPSH